MPPTPQQDAADSKKAQDSLPDAPTPQALPPQVPTSPFQGKIASSVKTLENINNDLEKHNVKLDFFSAYYQPFGTQEYGGHKAISNAIPRPSDNSVIVAAPPVLPNAKPFTVESLKITPEIGASVGFPVLPGSHRDGTNTFAGGDIHAQEVFKLWDDMTLTTRQKVEAGEAYYHEPKTAIVETGTPANPHTVEKHYHISKTGLDVGGDAFADLKVPLPGLKHAPSKSFGPDNLIEVGVPKHADIIGAVKCNTLECGATTGVALSPVKFFNGGLTLSVTENPASVTVFSNTGWHGQHGMNVEADVANMNEVEHGLDALRHKLLPHKKAGKITGP